MYELAIAELKKANEAMARKIPTMEESIKNYKSLYDNCVEELDKLKKTMKENEFVIGILENNKDVSFGGKLNAAMAQEADRSIAASATRQSMA